MHLKRELKEKMIKLGHTGRWRELKPNVWVLRCPNCGVYAYINYDWDTNPVYGISSLKKCKAKKEFAKIAARQLSVCLGCGRVFVSEGKYNRLCSLCRERNNSIYLETCSIGRR